MATHLADDIYERYIRALPAPERLRLLALVANDLAAGPATPKPGGRRSMMELHGLGRETWNGVDPDAYVDRLRDEWDEHG
jgi:hypothetical protein